jgi:hypothetical protein
LKRAIRINTQHSNGHTQGNSFNKSRIRAYNSVNVTSKFLLKPFVQKLTSDRSSTVVLTYYEVIFFAWAGLSIKRRAYVVLELSSLGTDQPGDPDFEEWIVPSQ